MLCLTNFIKKKFLFKQTKLYVSSWTWQRGNLLILHCAPVRYIYIEMKLVIVFAYQMCQFGLHLNCSALDFVVSLAWSKLHIFVLTLETQLSLTFTVWFFI